MLGMLAEWLVREWRGAFSTVGGPDWTVCLRMKATTKFACGRVAWLCLIGWGGLAIEAGCQFKLTLASRDSWSS